MKKLIWIGFASLVLQLGSAPRAAARPRTQSAPPESYRIATNDGKHRFPRWHPQVFLRSSHDTTNQIIKSDIASFKSVVDSRNLTHVVGTYTGPPDVAKEGLRYFNNSFENRKSNGFTEEWTRLDDDPTKRYADAFDAAVSPDADPTKPDVIHVVYTSFTASNDKNLFYRKKTNGSWGPGIKVTSIGDSTDTERYHSPSMAVDSAGTAHIVAMYEKTTVSGSTTLDMVHFTVSPSNEPFQQDNPAVDEWLLGPVVSAGKNAYIAYVQRVNNEYKLFCSNLSSWSPTQVHAAAADFTSFSFAVKQEGETDSIHFAWSRTNEVVKYSVKPADQGNFSNPENVSEEVPLRDVRIAVDAAKQPHVVWIMSPVAGQPRLSYAARSINPAFGSGSDRWKGRQEPCQDFIDFGSGQFCTEITSWQVGPTGDLHLGGFNNLNSNNHPFVTRTIEHNLGIQDSMAPGGGVAQVNLANGNLTMAVPVFASAGLGISANMSLVWNSRSGEPSPLSTGWTHSYHVYLVDSQSGVNGDVRVDQTSPTPKAMDIITLFLGDGRSIVFRWIESENGFLAYDEFGYFGKLNRDNNAFSTPYTLTDKMGTLYRFSNKGVLVEIEDGNRNKLTLTYEGGKLTTITDSNDRDTTFTYENGRLKDVTTADGRRNAFGYDTSADPKGRLTTLTRNAAGSSSLKPVWDFTYHASDDKAAFKRAGLLASVKPPATGTFEYFFYLDGRFRSCKDPSVTPASLSGGLDGEGEHQVVYVDPIEFDPVPTDEPRAEWQNRRGYKTKVVIQQRRSLATKITDPENNSVVREFDGVYRNLKKLTDQNQDKTEFIYTHEAGGQNPSYVKDNVTSIKRPSANATSGGAAASVEVARLSYMDGKAFVDGLTTPNPVGAGTVTTGLPRNGAGDLTGINFPSTHNRVTNVDQLPQSGIGVVAKGLVTSLKSPGGGTTSIVPDPLTNLPGAVKLPARGKAARMTYNAMGTFVTSTTSPEGGTTTYQPDQLDRAEWVDEPTPGQGLARTFYTYDLAGRVKTVLRPNEQSTTHHYDDLGRLVKTDITKGDGATLTTTYRYDAEGNIREIKDPKSFTTTQTFTARNLLYQVTRPGTPDPNVTTTHLYSKTGQLTKVTVGGDSTDLEYSARGLLKKVTHPQAGLTDENSYNEAGLLVSSIRKAGGMFKAGMSYSYDELGRVCGTAQLADGGSGSGHLTTTYGFDLDGNVTEIKDPLENTWTTTYDQGGRPLITRNPQGQIVADRSYDDNDRLRTLKGVNPKTGTGTSLIGTYDYWPNNQLKSVTDALSLVTSYTYYSNGDVETITTPETTTVNTTTKYVYNHFSRPTMVTQDFGRMAYTTEMGYDDNLNLEWVKDPAGKETRYTYNGLNLLKTMTYPGMAAQESWTYDGKGRPFTHTDRRGVVATFGYDRMDRRTSASYLFLGSEIANIQTAYDGASNVTEVLDTKTGVSQRFTDAMGNSGYDAFGRPLFSHILLNVGMLGAPGTLWKSASYTYRADSRLATFTDPQGQLFRYDYDPNGGLQAVTRMNGAGAPKTYATFFNDGAGRRREALFPNGMNTIWDYDQIGRLEGVRTVDGSGSLLSSFRAEYKPSGEREHIFLSHLSAKVTYGYDGLSRLTSETWTGNGVSDGFQNQFTSATPGNASVQSGVATTRPQVPLALSSYSATYGYDRSGNRDAMTESYPGESISYIWGYDGQNRVTTETVSGTEVASRSFDYTLNGVPGLSANIQQRQSTGPNGIEEETFTYDYANRLTGYVKRVAGNVVENYSYHFLPTGGTRFAKRNILGTVNNEEWYFSQGDDVCADYTRTSGQANFTSTSTYVNGAGIDNKIARLMPDGSELYYLTDLLGGVHRIVDQTGTLKKTALTNAWGQALPSFSAPTPAVTDRYGFTGRENSSESGLMQFRNREYDPRLGRFLQIDPLLGNRPLEHWIYAGNNPISRTDPTGNYYVIADGVDSDAKAMYLRAVGSWYGFNLAEEGGRLRITGGNGNGPAGSSDAALFRAALEDSVERDFISAGDGLFGILGMERWSKLAGLREARSATWAAVKGLGQSFTSGDTEASLVAFTRSLGHHLTWGYVDQENPLVYSDPNRRRAVQLGSMSGTATGYAIDVALAASGSGAIRQSARWGGSAGGGALALSGLTVSGEAALGAAGILYGGTSIVVAMGSGDPNFELVGSGSPSRKVNMRPPTPKWGLTKKHLDKHLWGTAGTALKQIDPGGNITKWTEHLMELLNSPVTGTTSNGMLDIIRSFPRADGSGSFRFGVRLSPKSDGTFDLVTLLTNQ